MKRTISRQKAENYPLLKDFSLEPPFLCGGGEADLLIPGRKVFTKTHYGFADLDIVRYLQKRFNEGLGITVEELQHEGMKDIAHGLEITVEELQHQSMKAKAIAYAHGDYKFKNPFLKETLSSLLNYRIITTKGRKKPFAPDTTLLQGRNYREARILICENRPVSARDMEF